MEAKSLSRAAAPRSAGRRAAFVALAWLALDQTGAFGQAPADTIPPGAGGAVKEAPKAAGNGVGRGFRGFMPIRPMVAEGGVELCGNLGALGDFGGNAGFGPHFSGPGQIGMVRFTGKIETNSPVRKLLPVPPVLQQPRPPWLVKDLTQVPEVFFEKPAEVKRLPADFQQKTCAEKEALVKEVNEARQKARENVARTLAKINHLNQKDMDRFVRLLMESRPDLTGLPFVLGDACRMNKDVSRHFVPEVASTATANRLRPSFGQFGASGSIGAGNGSIGAIGQIGQQLGGQIGALGGGGIVGPRVREGANPRSPQPCAEETQARVAAWMQMLAPEPLAKRKELVKTLDGIPHPDASRALGQLVVFSAEKELRDAALIALKRRAAKDYTPMLLHGLRYPWPDAAKNATEAMVGLDHQELVDTLVDFLDEPDPRAPFEKEASNGKKVTVVRELVRLNHHHNCITCHAPATSDPNFNKNGSTSEFVTGEVTVPGQSLTPTSGFGYMGGPFSFPDLAVRVDVTYLRQDFSLMQKVENGVTGQPLERFDYLVRSRAVGPQEVKAYQAWREKQGAKYLSPNHQAALAALRQLTGFDAAPTAAAWREALEGLSLEEH